MDKMTPGQLGVILAIAGIVTCSKILFDSRLLWWPGVMQFALYMLLSLDAFRHRYFCWRFPTADELADYVVRWQSEPINPPADLSVSAPVETETKAFPALSHAVETTGNSDFRFQSLEAANAYAETLLIDRLAELVLAEKLEKGIAIKVGLRAPTGRAYQAAKERLEAAMLKQQYPTLTASRTKAKTS